MKTFILLLAISAIVLTEDRLKTTKAKNEGMTHVLQRPVCDTKVYFGNPFQNGYIPKCRDDEFLDTYLPLYVVHGGLLIGRCQPQVKDSDKCPAAPPGGNITPTKQIVGIGLSICDLYCGDSKSSCPTGSSCQYDYCTYKQPDQKPGQKPDPAEAISSYEDGYPKNQTCNKGVFREDTIDGVKYGRCDPKVKELKACPAIPLGIDAYVYSEFPDFDGNKECFLRCDGQQNKTCPLGSQCIKDEYTKYWCYYLKSPTKQNFNNPFVQDSENPQCNEADGADAVQFTTKDGKKLGMCAPKASQGIQCPLYDTSKNHRRVSIAIGTHCQLPCDSNTDCAGGSQCLTINDDGKDRKICLYNTPVPSKTHDEFESSYPTADRLMLKPRDE